MSWYVGRIVFALTNGNRRVTQAFLEVVRTTPAQARVTQTFLEVVRS